MASIYDDPEMMRQIFTITQKGQRSEPLKRSLYGGSWLESPPSLEIGRGGLMPKDQRDTIEKLQVLSDIEAKKLSEQAKKDARELSKVVALGRKHPEVSGMGFQTLDEALSYLRYLQSAKEKVDPDKPKPEPPRGKPPFGINLANTYGPLSNVTMEGELTPAGYKAKVKNMPWYSGGGTRPIVPPNNITPVAQPPEQGNIRDLQALDWGKKNILSPDPAVRAKAQAILDKATARLEG